MTPQPSLGAAIRTRRMALGWSQTDLAARVSRHGDETFRQADVSRIESAKVGLPRRDRLEHIAAVLGLSVGELLARLGWTGAVSAFQAVGTLASGDQATTPSTLPVLGTALGSSGSGGIPTVGHDLRQIIEQARATRDSTAELLRRCEATRQQYEEFLSRFATAPRPSMNSRLSQR